MRILPWLRRTACLAALALVTTTVPAVASPPTADIGLLGGVVFPDDAVVGHGPDVDGLAPGFGVHGNYFLDDNWSIFADALISSFDGAPARFGDADLKTFRVGPRLFLPSLDDRLSFLVNAGLGYTSIGLDNADTISRPVLSGGIGQRFRMTDKLALHSEIRADRTLGGDADDAIEGPIYTAHALLGLSLTIGGGTEVRDSDGDGVPDGKDACPNTPRGAKVDRTGCPKDSDGDGVWDGLDQCPDTPAGLRVDARGCSDRDGDGVTDDRDQCPDTPAGWPVDAQGCPLDSDGDGVADGADQCPDTPKGVEVNENGCPQAERLFQVDEKTGEVKALILEGVNFEFNSATLTAGSRETLNRVAASLIAWPDVNVEVGGHTDSQGPDAYNQQLSQRRADSVRAYLVAQGVAAARMTTKGYGEAAPIASNDSDAGRAKNRRVELKKR